MVQKIINLYSFSELSKESQEKAINNLSNINVDYQWWDSIYDDAKTIGLKITSFGLDRNRHCEGEFINDADFCANEILSNHGKECETYKTASNYLDERSKLDIDEQEDELSALDEEFLNNILEDYSIILQNEYEYLQSDESIKETILANEYTFTESGKIENI